MKASFESQIPKLRSFGFSDNEILYLGTHHPRSIEEYFGLDLSYVKDDKIVDEVLTDENRKKYIRELFLEPVEDRPGKTSYICNGTIAMSSEPRLYRLLIYETNQMIVLDLEKALETFGLDLSGYCYDPGNLVPDYIRDLIPYNQDVANRLREALKLQIQDAREKCSPEVFNQLYEGLETSEIIELFKAPMY